MNQSITINKLFIIIIGLLSMLPPLAIDMYLPSFLEIAKTLQVSQENIQITLAIFTLGFSLGQLFWGPMADSFGRKPIIIIGLLGSSAMAFALTQTTDLITFYIFRLVQGSFAAAPTVVVGALVRDLFTRNQFARIMSSIMIITMLAPLLAPIIGGYLTKWFHWHFIFYILSAMGLISVILFTKNVPETLAPENREPLSFKLTIQNFVKVVLHKPTLGYVMVGGLSFSGMFCFLTSGSLVYIGIYGIPQENFGYFFFLNIGVLITMTFINGRVVTRFGSENMLKLGLTLQFIGAIWLIICATFQLGFWPMALGIAFFVGMVSTINSNASAAILDRYPQMAGTANAVAGTARFGIASIISSGLSHIPLTTERPMLYTMATCSLCASAVYYFLSYKKSEE
ncbi:Bcr/CflA family multidrug efflux MFS transporter [Otariodibacter oris]|uniref:Bcr/CflA family efflux transporter n=1 Tax=Otariodibacter oris TaxID=1032623 RepID=A0A420XHU4_9PAST|nr:Bcr/CflA family multidrug efflux MFS transporter [Otariodibacter oris]QGM80882.1 Bcr/CflA family drug resistance efflux transporter [Otariodibacter oris]RKR76944.1 DHA1 family bicyclomycin/chloramphenicol resistance-like MFS transporter [Otariodibacter oris]